MRRLLTSYSRRFKHLLAFILLAFATAWWQLSSTPAPHDPDPERVSVHQKTSFSFDWSWIYDLEDVYLKYYYIAKSSMKRGPSKPHLIPKILHQTWRTKNLSEHAKSILATNKRLNPDIEQRLWDDTEVDQFILTQFSSEVYSAFRAINPKVGAFY